MKRFVVFAALLSSAVLARAQAWPQPLPEAKAGTRWWWPGSAVDSAGLAWNLQQLASHGIGAVEITPIYGVQGNESRDLSFLSPEWFAALRQTQQLAAQHGIEVDMSTGTGWPFGGPWVPIDEAACKAVFIDTLVDALTRTEDMAFALPEKEKPFARLSTAREFPTDEIGKKRVIALFVSRTRQRVKRAAPGGEGFVVDHFDRAAVAHYLAHIDSAFTASGTPFPHTFFNDSFEVYGADWTPTLLEEFHQRRGYRLEDRFDRFLDDDVQTLSDYRETLSELLLENFTQPWTAWAHRHGAITRNQAHGSPANLIDCYAAVDIPEIEGFGLSDFGIRGLRTDSGFTRPNFSDLSMMKYAPSAAHIAGKPFTSSETFTWLTEHFRTSLSQLKPDLDLLFCAGVNHIFFHGTAYSPEDAPWPGWRFYASIDMGPNNSLWRDAPFFMQYVERCQSFLQWGQPDNDFLVYLPIYNMWRRRPEKRFLQFDIHKMGETAPDFIRTIMQIDSLGYDCDYISDRYLCSTTFRNGMLQTAVGTRYRALVIPAHALLSEATRQHIDSLKALGAPIINGVDADEMGKNARPEALKLRHGLHLIRRTNATGHHYFIANLTPRDVAAWVPLSVACRRAVWFNPMDGSIEEAQMAEDKVWVSLRSGESRILQTYQAGEQPTPPQPSVQPRSSAPSPIDLTHQPWTLAFTEEAPRVEQTFALESLTCWEHLSPQTAITMSTGVYTTQFRLSRQQAAGSWRIDLGDVRESARVYLNGRFVGCAWAVPFVLDCTGLLRAGRNTLRIEVTNLPANRIADMDRRGVAWRCMKEINVVDIHYQKTRYDHWQPVRSGLSSVKLMPYE